MSGYALHPEAYADLDDIRGYVAHDNPDAADRLITEIFDAIRSLVPFPGQGHNRPDLTPRPLRFILVREYLISLRAGAKTSVGCCSHARTAQPSRDGRDPQSQRVAPAVRLDVGPNSALMTLSRVSAVRPTRRTSGQSARVTRFPEASRSCNQGFAK